MPVRSFPKDREGGSSPTGAIESDELSSVAVKMVPLGKDSSVRRVLLFTVCQLLYFWIISALFH
jgi:hypothetical protein